MSITHIFHMTKAYMRVAIRPYSAMSPSNISQSITELGTVIQALPYLILFRAIQKQEEASIYHIIQGMCMMKKNDPAETFATSFRPIYLFLKECIIKNASVV